MKIDLNNTKHRALLLSPSVIAILLLGYTFFRLLFNFKTYPFVMPIYMVIMAYIGIISFVLFIHDTRRDNRKYKRQWK